MLPAATGEIIVTTHNCLTVNTWQRHATRLVFAGVGLLLLVAAALKLLAGDAGALGQNAVLFSPTMQMLAVAAELALVGWLLTGWWKTGSWAAALLFFSMLAATSLSLALQGQSSCGCFGRVEVHPWATFALDAVVLIALAIFRPRPFAGPTLSPQARPAVAAMAGALALILLGSIGLMAYWNVGAEGLVARLRGQTLTVGPSLSELGTKPAGESVVFPVTVTNYSDHEVSLVGGAASCSCAVVSELPLAIPAGANREVPVRATFKGSPGRFQHEVLLYTNVPGQLQLVSRFGGTVAAAR